MHNDEKFMKRCFELAKMGSGNVAPNPFVGAVVVYEDEIIGEGYHQKYGEAHAEVNAIDAVSNKDLLSDSTIYVSLEPCAHHGKTPPCADLIVKHRFKRVVIGCGDTFNEVNGKGIQRLRENGIEVTTFVLEEEARAINKAFFTFQEKKRPYVLLKWAQSRDGFIDAENTSDGEITWISRPEVQPIVHQLRADYQAILVGKNTVINDNPSLTVRTVAGNNPVRIILDSHCEIPNEKTVLSDGLPTIVLNLLKTSIDKNLTYHQITEMSVKTILDALYEKNIQSVMVEGGAKTLQAFIDANLWDEALLIQGQNSITAGTKAPIINAKLVEEHIIFGDQLKFFKP